MTAAELMMISICSFPVLGLAGNFSLHVSMTACAPAGVLMSARQGTAVTLCFEDSSCASSAAGLSDASVR